MLIYSPLPWISTVIQVSISVTLTGLASQKYNTFNMFKVLPELLTYSTYQAVYIQCIALPPMYWGNFMAFTVRVYLCARNIFLCCRSLISPLGLITVPSDLILTIHQPCGRSPPHWWLPGSSSRGCQWRTWFQYQTCRWSGFVCWLQSLPASRSLMSLSGC